MANPAPSKSVNLPYLLKLSGGVLFLIWAVMLLIHRFPKMGYVDIIPDAPKPPPAAAAPAAPPKEPPKPAAVVKAPVMPAALLVPMTPTGPLLDIEEACEVEIGILCCCHMPVKELPGCLTAYEEGLRKNCLKALDQRRVGPR